ncbi:hypothetical protein ATANTOWER_010684 [Ataeniobius toweri]|uniref:PDZ domain-containing protein n=1 Tax=Ataeniobius toweri TaxID=208326 RepID=A0ABU7B618_9TELE|nr:hypothetical protein [Ataeniobius toweri]
MDLLPPSTSENIPLRSGARFTVRSANSPSYNFTRRPGVRNKLTAGNVEGTSGTNKKEDMGVVNQTQLNQNGTSERKHPENETDVGTPALDNQGRTEGRGCSLPSTNMSLDWRSGARSPPRSTRPCETKLFGKREAGGFEEQRTKIQNNMSRTLTSLKGFNSADPSYIENNCSVKQGYFLDRVSKVKSLPIRFKTESGPDLRFTDSLLGPQGEQSIQERIQLFESAGEMTAGETFPRRFSSGEDYSPVRKTLPSIWAQKETNPTRSETLSSSKSVKLKERSAGTQRQGQFSSKYLEDDRWVRDAMVMGTKSLDRVRSRNTVAARIQSARTAAGMAESQAFVGDTLSIFQQRRASINQEESRENMAERIKVQESNKERYEKTKQQTELKIGITEGDVLDTNPRKGSLQSPERNKLPEIPSVPSSASVRNKISQFEALTQKATSQVHIPRRTFSVPAKLNKAQEGEKRNGFAKYVDEGSNKWAMKTYESIEKTKRLGLERSLSVDEVGIRFDKSETDGSNFLDKSKNYFSKDLGKYSSLKKTLHIPLNEGAQRRSRLFCFDETDFVKHSSPKDSNMKDMTTNTVTSDMHPRPQCEISSPVSDDDKTPTNTPLNTSPFLSPVKEPEDIFVVAGNTVTGQEDKTKNTDSTLLPSTTLFQNSKTDIFITHTKKTEDKDSPHLPPDTSSHNNLSDVFYPDVKPELQKGRKQLLDLNEWIARINPEFKSWNEYMGEYEDDDERTQKDDDSNYDSDSGDSSMTITSNMSQSEHKSFSLSFSDLCNFSGAHYESVEGDDRQLGDRRSASLSSDVSGFSCVSLLPTEELDKLVEDVKNLGDEALQDYNDVQVVVLHKEVGAGLGFSLAGGVDQNKPITVHKVFDSGVAAQEGSIMEGDHVLSINGTALSESAHWEALRTLRKAKAQETVVVVLRKGDLSGASKVGVQENYDTETRTQYETGQRVCVQLQKNSRDLGFSLQGGVGSSEGNRPLTVQKIFQGGPVDKVFPGDEILEIQGISVVGMRRLEVWTFIKTLASGPVEVELRRPDASPGVQFRECRSTRN